MKEKMRRKRAWNWITAVCFAAFLLCLPVGVRAAAGKLIYVSQEKGSDTGEGTKASPYKTIGKAAEAAQPGDTVIVQKGVYRECVKPARGGTGEDARITYLAEEPGQAVIKGSEQITNWTKDGDIWKVELDSEAFFGDYNPYKEGHGKDDSKYFPVYNCGDVYLNEEAYYQKASVEEVRANTRTWCSEVKGEALEYSVKPGKPSNGEDNPAPEGEKKTIIYANFGDVNPNEQLAEINVRQQCFAPDEWGLAYITVNGFKVQHAANMYSDFPGYPEHCQSGAISTNGGLKWIIENNMVIHARTIAIDIGLRCDRWAGNRDPRAGKPDDTKYFTSYKDTEKYGQHIVRNNLIQKCGQCGIAGVFSWKSQILNNVIEDTNYRNEFIAAETGGIKVHYCNDGLIKGNYIRNTVGGGSAGIWTDWGNQGIRITQNVLVNNNWGYYAEAVVGPILVDNNVFIENNNFRSLDGAGVVFANNLFVNETMAYDGEGRNCMVFEPHTMNDSEVKSVPQYFQWFNNISIGKAIVKPKGSHSVMSGNLSKAGTKYTCQARTDGVTLSFDLDAEPTGEQVMVNPALVGTIEPAGEGIRAIVNRDYFGKPFEENAMVAGPFADVKKGKNTYTLWPLADTAVPPSKDTEPVNLAQGKTVTASSQAGDNTPDKAVDGSSGSRYESAQTDQEWFQVDLGESIDIRQVKILWESAYAKAYTLKISDDAANWKDVYTTANGDGGTDLLEFAEKGRYIRMEMSERALPYGYSFYEFQVYGATDAASAVPPVFKEIPSQTVNEGQPLSFRAEASDSKGRPVSYRVLGTLPAGAELDGKTGNFSWTPNAAQSGFYTVSFLADNGEAVSACTVIIQVVEAQAADTQAPAWTNGSCTASEVTDNSLHLSWTAAVDEGGVACYRIYQDGHLCREVAGNVTEAVVTGLAAGKSYRFVVTAEDTWGNHVAVEDGLSLQIKTVEENYGAAQGISKTYPREYKDWSNAFVAGDGKIGMMVFGNPLQETVIINDRKFFMAATTDKPERQINTASKEDLDKIKEHLTKEEWKEANDLANKVHGWKDGGEGNKHPGYEIRMDVLGDGGEVKDYSRTLDYATGEIVVNWEDSRGTWERKSFVSRKDNVAVQYLTRPSAAANFGCSVWLGTDEGMHLPSGMTFTDASTEDFLNFRATYANAGGAGYEGVTKVVTDGQKTLAADGKMTIQNATYVLLLTKNEKYYTDCTQGWGEKKLQAALDKLDASYETLMAGQAETHKEIYDRVSLNLKAPAEDRLKTNEELLAMQKKSSKPVLALYEKIFAAGRYHYLSSSSDVAPPDLLGLWTGDTNVGWSGYYHLDANLNLQISSGNIGNMPEAMEGYFHMMDAWKDDFRTNAQKLLGCRGFLSGGNSPGETSGIISSLNYAYPYQYVTGGEAWLLYPFWEYYEITGDKAFLRDRLFPYLKEMGYFYEDFLTEKDENGKYIFAGSISPESQPKGLGMSLVNNSTFDITGAQFVLQTLLKTCEILNIEESADTPISKWEEILENLPPYLINKDGALSEWSWPSLKDSDNYGHRHSSHLIGVWPYRIITAETTPDLFAAAQTALQKKDGNAYENAGHGILHAAMIATNLNNGKSAGAKILRLLKDNFYFDSLTTAHYNNRNVFCTDVANTVPGIMMEMCMSSTEDSLELLPAIPAELSQGHLSGLKAKCRVTLDDLVWNLDEGTVSCRLTSDINQTVTLIERSGIKSVEADVKTEASDLGDIAKKLTLKAGEPATVTMKVKAAGEDQVRNLALDKPADAMSSSNEAQGPDKAFDGDPGTRWSCSEKDENWISVDLEDVYMVESVTLNWEESYAREYKIQISQDGETWTDVYETHESPGGVEKIQLDAPVEARFVKMQGIKKAGQWGYSLYEFEVYGRELPPPENVALNKTAAASTQSNANQGAEKAFDGDMGTRWGAHEDADNWLMVDLEAYYDLSSVKIYWEDSYAAAYKLQISLDGRQWQDVFTEDNNEGGVNEIPLETRARYVKMQGVEKSGPWGYSLYEMEVYGKLSADQTPPSEDDDIAETLAELVREAEEMQASAYTEESYANLQTAIGGAKDALAKEEPVREELEQALATLQEAIDSLEILDPLEAALKRAEAAEKAAEDAKKQAEEAKKAVQEARDEADRLVKAAEEARTQMEEKANASQKEKEAAEEAAKAAQAQAAEAVKRAEAAETEARKAMEAQKAAEKAAAEADARARKAEEALKDPVKAGQTYTVGGLKYAITNVKNKTVSVTGLSKKNLKKLVIPATVKIGKETYKVTEIGKNACKGDKKLEQVTVGSNVKTIGSNAFYKNTGLKKVTIGKNVQTIGSNAFYGDAKLKNVSVKSGKLKTVGKNAFKGMNKKAVIKVPAKKAAAYRKLFKKAGQPKSVKIK